MGGKNSTIQRCYVSNAPTTNVWALVLGGDDSKYENGSAKTEANRRRAF